METHSAASLSETIIGMLRGRILNWEYPPGYKVTEQALCEEFDVSRSPVREALRVLVAEGLMEKTYRKGHVVRRLESKEIEDLYELRLALELFSIERLAGRGLAAPELVKMRSPWEAIQGDARLDKEMLAKMDREFHESLALAMGNMALYQQLVDINERLGVFRVVDFSIERRLESTCRQHLEILERIEARDVTGARRALESNIRDSMLSVRHTIHETLERKTRLAAREHSTG